jgi:N-acetylglutamate synthase/N-acetylornithine aminotransferase
MMLKAGANEGASGQNAIVFSVGKVDIIVGSVAVLAANSYSGELTARMAEAIASADAMKILIPLNKCGIEISGVIEEPLPVQVDHLVNQVKNILQNFER